MGSSPSLNCSANFPRCSTLHEFMKTARISQIFWGILDWSCQNWKVEIKINLMEKYQQNVAVNMSLIKLNKMIKNFLISSLTFSNFILFLPEMTFEDINVSWDESDSSSIFIQDDDKDTKNVAVWDNEEFLFFFLRHLKELNEEQRMKLSQVFHPLDWLTPSFQREILSQSKSKSKVQSPKSKGLGVTLFCYATTTSQTLLFKLKIKNSVSKFYSGLWHSRVQL